MDGGATGFAGASDQRSPWSALPLARPLPFNGFADVRGAGGRPLFELGVTGGVPLAVRSTRTCYQKLVIRTLLRPSTNLIQA